MSAISPELLRNCPRCSAELRAGGVVCDKCHALIHSATLEKLSEEGRKLESQGELRRAREQWLLCLPMLPYSSKQADWIRAHARALDDAADQLDPPESENKWARKLGPVGPIAILLAKSKALLTAVFQLKFLFSFLTFFAIYWHWYGPNFGLGLAFSILIHEMGHFIDIKRRGLPADMPVFLPGFGAYVRWRAIGVSRETRAEVSLAGPLAGAIAAFACALLWWKTGNGLWAALAHTGAALNLLNLIPVWVLDGGQAAEALSKLERIGILTLCLALWLILSNALFFLVAMGAGYRLFTKDLPARPSLATTAYFAAVLFFLAAILHFCPGQGLGTQ